MTFNDHSRLTGQHAFLGASKYHWINYDPAKIATAYAEKLLGEGGGLGIYPPGLGRANGWVHVDVRKDKSRWKG